MSTEKKPFEFYQKNNKVWVKFDHQKKQYDLPADKVKDVLMFAGGAFLAFILLLMLFTEEPQKS